MWLLASLFFACSPVPPEAFAYTIEAEWESTTCGELPGEDSTLEYSLTVAEDGEARIWWDEQLWARGVWTEAGSVLSYSTDTKQRGSGGETHSLRVEGRAVLDGGDWSGTETLYISESSSDLGAPCTYVYALEGGCAYGL